MIVPYKGRGDKFCLSDATGMLKEIQRGEKIQVNNIYWVSASSFGIQVRSKLTQ